MISNIVTSNPAVITFTIYFLQMGAGRVNQALAGAMSQVLKDYYVFVAELETQQRQGDLTLNKVLIIGMF